MMLIKKQDFSLQIKNFDTNKKPCRKHGDIFGGDCKRGLIIGPSGCGKTNLILSLLTDVNGLRFENVYVYSKSLRQAKYEYLKNLFTPLKYIGYFESSDGENIVPPSEIRANSIIIFDDIVCCEQSIMRDYFCFGRHQGTDCFYLCQTYSSIPKQLIRDNANLLVIFQQDNTNLKHIYDDHVNSDMSLQQFKDLCAACWREKYDFVVIDKDCSPNNGRYRKGFDNFIYI
jgi:energy-coupling factor transporter ATP-binding protein EcfA2